MSSNNQLAAFLRVKSNGGAGSTSQGLVPAPDGTCDYSGLLKFIHAAFKARLPNAQHVISGDTDREEAKENIRLLGSTVTEWLNNQNDKWSSTRVWGKNDPRRLHPLGPPSNAGKKFDVTGSPAQEMGRGANEWELDVCVHGAEIPEGKVFTATLDAKAHALAWWANRNLMAHLLLKFFIQGPTVDTTFTFGDEKIRTITARAIRNKKTQLGEEKGSHTWFGHSLGVHVEGILSITLASLVQPERSEEALVMFACLPRPNTNDAVDDITNYLSDKLAMWAQLNQAYTLPYHVTGEPYGLHEYGENILPMPMLYHSVSAQLSMSEKQLMDNYVRPRAAHSYLKYVYDIKAPASTEGGSAVSTDFPPFVEGNSDYDIPHSPEHPYLFSWTSGLSAHILAEFTEALSSRSLPYTAQPPTAQQLKKFRDALPRLSPKLLTEQAKMESSASTLPLKAARPQLDLNETQIARIRAYKNSRTEDNWLVNEVCNICNITAEASGRTHSTQPHHHMACSSYRSVLSKLVPDYVVKQARGESYRTPGSPERGSLRGQRGRGGRKRPRDEGPGTEPHHHANRGRGGRGGSRGSGRGGRGRGRGHGRGGGGRH